MEGAGLPGAPDKFMAERDSNQQLPKSLLGLLATIPYRLIVELFAAQAKDYYYQQGQDPAQKRAKQEVQNRNSHHARI